jgi:hypothetical protein
MPNRLLAALLLLLAAETAWAQMVPKPAPRPPCAECAVVRSVRAITRELASSPGSESKPSGLVATIPLGKGGDKARFGSSTDLGTESRETDTRWEVTLRYEDGRLRLITLGEEPELKEGDKVRIDRNGRIQPRND